MNNIDFTQLAKWLMYGAAMFLGYSALQFAVGFITAWVEDMQEEAAALEEVKRMNYFPRLRYYPANLQRFATIHNGRILDILDLGRDEEDNSQYYYLHVARLSGECGSMLVQAKGDTLTNLRYSNNRVAQALVAKCETYVHLIDLTVMLRMFVARVMSSEPQEQETSPVVESED